jgi:hypothetical protein
LKAAGCKPLLKTAALAISVSHQGRSSSIRGAWKSVPLKMSLRFPPYTHRRAESANFSVPGGAEQFFGGQPLCLRSDPLDPYRACVVRFSTRRHNRNTLMLLLAQADCADLRDVKFARWMRTWRSYAINGGGAGGDRRSLSFRA